MRLERCPMEGLFLRMAVNGGPMQKGNAPTTMEAPRGRPRGGEGERSPRLAVGPLRACRRLLQVRVYSPEIRLLFYAGEQVRRALQERPKLQLRKAAEGLLEVGLGDELWVHRAALVVLEVPLVDVAVAHILQLEVRVPGGVVGVLVPELAKGVPFTSKPTRGSWKSRITRSITPPTGYVYASSSLEVPIVLDDSLLSNRLQG